MSDGARATEHPAAGRPARPGVGYAAMAVTVAVWAGFALSLRGISSSRLQVADVALLRFGVPTLLLLPLLPSRWAALRRVPAGAAGALLLGAGVPFFFTATAGGALTSAAAVGTLVPGLVPAFTALGRRGRPAGVRGRRGGVAVALVVVGVLVLVVPGIAAGTRGVLAGAALLVAASGLWAAYTGALARIGLDAVGCALLLCLPSTVVVAVLLATRAVPSSLATARFGDLLPFLLVQGLGVGFLAALTYPVAVQSLGPQRAAVLGTMSPVVVAVLAVPLLGEGLGPATAGGVALVTAGVLLAQAAPRRDPVTREGAVRA